MSRWSLVEHNGVPMSLRELSDVSGVNYNTLLKRYRMGDRGEKLTRPVERKPGGFIYFCAHCEREFWRHCRGAKYCSHRCSRRGQALKREDVQPFVRGGAMAKAASQVLGVHPGTFSEALKRLGLYRAWQRARYAKCKVGNTQSTPRRESQIGTASSASAGNTPSARSEGRTVSAMSCG